MTKPSSPRARLLLLKDFRRESFAGSSDEESGAGSELETLAREIGALCGIEEVDVELEPQGRSAVAATVPARNSRERDRLKALINERLDGWKVIEEQSYRLPTTF